MASSIDIYTKKAKVTTFLKMRLIGITSHDVIFVQKKPFFCFMLEPQTRSLNGNDEAEEWIPV